MSLSCSGWLTQNLERKYEELAPKMTFSGKLFLQLPRGDEFLDRPPITLHWRREYEPEVLVYADRLIPEQGQKIAPYHGGWGIFKFALDDRLRCTFSYGEEPLKLNIVLNHVYDSSAGNLNKTQLKQSNVAQLPCQELFLRLYQGINVDQYFTRQGSVWQLAGSTRNEDGGLCHSITYQFDLEKLECTYLVSSQNIESAPFSYRGPVPKWEQ